MVSDPISNMLIALKNASMVGKPTVIVPFSKFKLAIAEVLERNGFIDGVSERGKKVKRSLEIKLAYKDSEPKIKDLARTSKPSRRLYKGFKDLKAVKQGFGLEVLSTPQGLLTGKEARAAKVGGESLFMIW